MIFNTLNNRFFCISVSLSEWSSSFMTFSFCEGRSSCETGTKSRWVSFFQLFFVLCVFISPCLFSHCVQSLLSHIHFHFPRGRVDHCVCISALISCSEAQVLHQRWNCEFFVWMGYVKMWFWWLRAFLKVCKFQLLHGIAKRGGG